MQKRGRLRPSEVLQEALKFCGIISKRRWTAFFAYYGLQSPFLQILNAATANLHPGCITVGPHGVHQGVIRKAF